jgi:4-amino-4-deoxy-L-arabinose transferase-like glycosyltransferase
VKPTTSRLRELLPLAAILALAATLRLYDLAGLGWGRTYYAAAVRSMLESWHCVVYVCFDPAGFVSLDKPPVAIWLQALSAKILGFSGWSILFVQAVEGVLSVAMLYVIVRRVFGAGTGLLAALLLAITPISIAVDRSNNTESCLVLVLLAAAWAGIRAVETGRLAWLVASMALIGIGFNVKMAAAWALAPVIVLTFLAGRRKDAVPATILKLAAAGAVLLAVSLAWIALFDLTPASDRPYAGSTASNTMRELVLQHNGLSRFTTARSDIAASTVPGLWDTSPPGPLRLLRAFQASQAGWWLPFALVGIVMAWRTEGPAHIAGPAGSYHRMTLGVLAGWLAVYWAAFSFAGGIFHTYYLALLAPPLAAFVASGMTMLWRLARLSDPARRLALCVIAATGAWQAWLAFGTLGWQPGPTGALWLRNLALACAAVAIAVPLHALAARRWQVERPVAVKWLAALSAAALVPLPLLTAGSVLRDRVNPSTPSAKLALLVQPPPQIDPATIQQRVAAARGKLISFLQAQRSGERYLLATQNALVAAPIIISTGTPVLAIGGYTGTDPILTPADLARMVEARQLRYVMLGGLRLTTNADTAQKDIAAWVRANGRAVPATQWRLDGGASGPTYRLPINGQWVTMPVPELFDLRR